VPSHLIAAVALGTAIGALARFDTLRIDYRQYPSYPQGYTIHMTLGVIASFLGAVAIPALSARDFAAASFLALAATQFREVRSIERETLLNLEESELVPRGKAYIEGIARVFEARNYLAMMTAFVTSGAAVIAGGPPQEPRGRARRRCRRRRARLVGHQTRRARAPRRRLGRTPHRSNPV